MSERTQQLKKKIVFKSVTVSKVGADGHVMAEVARDSKLSPERARLVTESFKATEGEPMVIRRAKSLAHVLENMLVRIGEGELIVGNYSGSSRDLLLDPEMSCRCLSMALELGKEEHSYTKLLDEKDREEFKEVMRYWQGKSVYDRIMAILPKRLVDYISYNGVAWSPHVEDYPGLESPNVSKVLKIGLNGIIKQIKARLEEIEGDEALPADEYIEQRHNLEAMLIAAKAAINFGKRFAAKARELAFMQKDGKRKEELLSIAEVCDWVPANPARTLHEAIQSYWFCLLICKQIENPNAAGAGHRLDIILNPFYQEDRRKGRITRQEAQELVECLFIKIADLAILYPPTAVQQVGGGQSKLMDINIGGVTSSGDDATNEFSFIILDAAESVRLPEPTIALRYHPKISPELISKAIDVVKTGVGYPAFYNDLAYIPWFQATGYTLEKARNYGIASCVGQLIQDGENYGSYHAEGGVINLSKCLELAFYQGKDKDRYGGRQLGSKTPDLRNATCIEEVMDAYLKQVGYVAHKLAEIDNIRNAFVEEYQPRPFASLLTDGCIEKGKNSLTWEPNGVERFLFTGTTNVANSLAAIKMFVFDKKLITMEELIEACRTNFEGREELRQMLINRAPKYGNDDDYVDALAAEVHSRTNAEVMQAAKTRWGFPYFLDASIVGGYFAASTNCGAIPDGKKDGEPTADASISPSAGTDKKGPTAVLKSASKIPFTHAQLLNQKFLPQFLEGENKQKFAQYLKTWCDLGIGHIQFNVVDRAMLLDAQAHPEKYTNLIVRVAGYSAYFIDLAKPLQDDIIRRVEQQF